MIVYEANPIFEDFSIKTNSIYSFLNEAVSMDEAVDVTIIDFFNDDFFSEAQELTPEQQKRFDELLKKNKINNFNAKLKKSTGEISEIFGVDLALVGMDIAKFAYSKLSEEGFTSTAKEEIHRYTNKKYREISETITSNFRSIDPGKISNKEEFQKYLNDEKAFSAMKLKSAINLFIKVLFSSMILTFLFGLIFGPMGGQILSAVVVAPVIEENAKIVAVKGDFILEFNLVFNAFEFSEYVILGAASVGVGKIIAMRVACVGMHLTTSLIHWLAEHTTILKKIPAPKKLAGAESDDPDVKATLIGKFVGSTIHFVWNTIAVATSIK